MQHPSRTTGTSQPDALVWPGRAYAPKHSVARRDKLSPEAGPNDPSVYESWSGSVGRNLIDNLAAMSSRLDRSWMVLASHETPQRDRCVDVFARPDGTFGFEEFRRDPEDLGAWTPISYFSGLEYPTAEAAVVAARAAVPWLASAD